MRTDLIWTNRDAATAAKEGWNIFNGKTDPEIQRDDEAAIFRSDADAITFVKGSSSPHCVKAVKIIAAAALNAEWSPKPGDACWCTNSMSQGIIEINRNDGTFGVRKANGKRVFASRAAIIPLAAFSPRLRRFRLSHR